MRSIEDISKEQTINEELDHQYDTIIETLQKAKEEQRPIDEGLFSAILGGTAGLTFGPAVMKAVCKALGVDVKGTFGSLLTSRLVLTAVGTEIGWKV